jgi:trypsin
MTASTIRFVLQLQSWKRLTRGSTSSQPPRHQLTGSLRFDVPCDCQRNAIHIGCNREQCRVIHHFKLAGNYSARTKILAVTITGLTLLLAPPACAIVGGGAPSAEGIGRSIVTIVGSRGNFCSGVLVAPKLVLTAAHCVQPGAVYKIVEYGADRKPKLQDVRTIAIHPAFNMQAIIAHRASADVALLQLEQQVQGASAAIVAAPQLPIIAGGRFTIAGVGVAVRGEGKSGGIVRAADLVTTGRPGALQIRLVDPIGQGTREGLGACTGDSGGPVFEDRPTGAVVVGVISWSTGPNGAAGCGGLTGVTPLTLYRDWILQTARGWGSAL